MPEGRGTEEAAIGQARASFRHQRALVGAGIVESRLTPHHTKRGDLQRRQLVASIRVHRCSAGAGTRFVRSALRAA